MIQLDLEDYINEMKLKEPRSCANCGVEIDPEWPDIYCSKCQVLLGLPEIEGDKNE